MGLCEGRCHYSPVHVLPFHQNSHIVARGNSISLFHPTVAFQQVLRSLGSSCAARMVSFHVFPPVLQLRTRQTAPGVVTFFQSLVAMTSILVASWLLIMKNLIWTSLSTSAAGVKQRFWIVGRKKIFPFVEPDERLEASIRCHTASINPI